MTKKLAKNKYETSKELCADIRLMFENCYEYNTPKSLIYKQAKELENYVQNELLPEFSIEDDY